MKRQSLVLFPGNATKHSEDARMARIRAIRKPPPRPRSIVGARRNLPERVTVNILSLIQSRQ